VALPGRSATVLMSTHMDRVGETLPEACDLRPDEGLIALVA
jgi:hypothetical protein